MSHTKDTAISILTNYKLISGIIMPLRVPTKIIRSNSDNHIDPNTAENFPFQDTCFGGHSHRFPFQNTAT